MDTYTYIPKTGLGWVQQEPMNLICQKVWQIQGCIVHVQYFLSHNWQSKGCPQGLRPFQPFSHVSSHLSLQYYFEVGTIISILLLRKLRLGEVEQLALGHTANKGWRQDLDTTFQHFWYNEVCPGDRLCDPSTHLTTSPRYLPTLNAAGILNRAA